MNKTALNSQKEKHSMLSLRRATCGKMMKGVAASNFYPRSPCGERLLRLYGTVQHTYFYPRSPCGERQKSMGTEKIRKLFLSTLSLRRATISAK